MADIRESILARLVVIATAVSGVTTVVRNRGQLTDAKRPAIIIMDADETGDDGDPPRHQPNAIRRVAMEPQIYLLLTGKSEDVGTSLNVLRAKVVKSIMTDTTLIDLTLDSTGVRYDGCSTGLAMGRSMEGEMLLSFTFTYLLKAADL